MKNELLKDRRFSRIEEVNIAVAHAVDFYNNERPHMSIDMMTPSEAAFCEGEIKKHWISYRERAIKEKQALGQLRVPRQGQIREDFPVYT